MTQLTSVRPTNGLAVEERVLHCWSKPAGHFDPKLVEILFARARKKCFPSAKRFADQPQ